MAPGSFPNTWSSFAKCDNTSGAVGDRGCSNPQKRGHLGSLCPAQLPHRGLQAPCPPPDSPSTSQAVSSPDRELGDRWVLEGVIRQTELDARPAVTAASAAGQ